MNTKQYKGGLTTLTNLVNTCYINSILQVLKHTDVLNIFLDKIEASLNNNKNGHELKEWNSLRNLMWSRTCIVSPNRFNYAIEKSGKMKGFTSNHTQEDGSEYLIKLLDAFHLCVQREVNMTISGNVKNTNDKIVQACYMEYRSLYEKHYSEIIDMFYGMQVTNIYSMAGDILSSRIEPYSIVNLVIPMNTATTFEKCLDDYFKDEELVGDNKWFNEKTNEKQDVVIRTRFFSTPEVLIFCFKKFFDKKQFINFPIDELDMSKHNVVKKNKKDLYSLYAICNHDGGPGGGHYHSYVKYNQKWYCFNDTNVNMISSNKLITSAAYCLFYKKIV